ncbi:MAG: SdrD B-like domain-containing protein, partial [Leptothrix sp. (in: b-proteobacteria)]
GGVSVADPIGKPGPQLRFKLGSLATGGTAVLSYRVRLGVGAQQGSGINRAQATTVPGGACSATSASCSNEASHRVKVSGGVFTSEACVTGKVFVDCNHNHVQDDEELGVPGVRLYLEDGSSVITDVEGKYSQCSLAPKTHVLVVDQTTLPRGSRLTTSSNRNAGDAASLFLDLKNGELHRADFIEGSCSNTVLEQVKARRSRGEVNAIDTEKQRGRVLKFDGKPVGAPAQATDSANQRSHAAGQGEPGAVKPRLDGGRAPPPDASTATGQTIHAPVNATPTSSGATQPEPQP